MNNIDLVVFTPTLAGGVGRVIFNLADGLQKRGYQVEILTVKKDIQDVKFEGVKVVDLSCKRTIQALPKLINYLKENNPKVLLSAIYHANIISSFAHLISGQKSKLILTEHIALKQSLAHEPFLLSFMLKVLVKLLFRRADRIIAVSNGAADDLKEMGLPENKIDVIYNPVITREVFSLAEQSPSHPWFLDKTVPIILGVGRLTEQKDFATLIKAFILVRKELPARLVIVGEGEEKNRLNKMISNYNLQDSACLLGHQNNPYPFFKYSSVFVLTSRWEGFGNVLVEALCLGSSVVSSDCPSGPKEILKDGKLGSLVPPGDDQAFAKAIIKMLESPLPKPREEELIEFTSDYAINKYEIILFKS